MSDVLMQFSQPHKGYNMGETARFRPHAAEELLKLGVAHEVDPGSVRSAEETVRRRVERPEMVVCEVIDGYGPYAKGETIQLPRPRAEHLQSDKAVRIVGTPDKPEPKPAEESVGVVPKQARPPMNKQSRPTTEK